MDDPTEVELGIRVYLSGNTPDGFSAVLKARYSDFLVHEGMTSGLVCLSACEMNHGRTSPSFVFRILVKLCGEKAVPGRVVVLASITQLVSLEVLTPLRSNTVGMDGSVARLDSLDSKLIGGDDAGDASKPSTTFDEPSKRQRFDQDNNVTREAEAATHRSPIAFPTGSNADAAPQPLDWELLRAELEGLVGSDAANSTLAFLQQPAASASPGELESSETSLQEYVVLPASSKEVRRALHDWVRLRLDSVALSDTENGCVRLWLKRYEHKMNNYNTFNRPRNAGRKRKDAQEHSPPGYLRFVLYKENMDTGTAMHHLQQSVQPQPSRNGNPRQQRPPPRVRLGFAGMKDKRGITSQFVTLALDKNRPAPQVAEALCRRWNQSRNASGGEGGGHTQCRGLGVMRVGHFSRVSDELRLGSLRGNRFDIVLRNLQEDEAAVTRAAQALRQRGFVNYFGVQRFGKYHDTHRVGMAVLRGDYRAATDLVLGPRPDEPDPVRQARLEWQNRFADEPIDDIAEAERRCAQAIVKHFSRFMNTEVALLQSLARHPLDYQRAFKCIAKTMRMMFLHAVQSFMWNHTASHRLQSLGHDVVEGDLVLEDSDASKSNSVRFVTKEDVDSRRYTLEDVVLPVIGTTTVDPKNSCGAFMVQFFDEQKLSRQMFNDLNDRDLDVKGDYRKLLCHPKDVDFEVLHYNNPLQPLVQTDLMRLQNLSVDVTLNGEDSSLHAIRVGFTLPPSSYATIALRELMKQPTSSTFQSGQKLGTDTDQQPAREVCGDAA